MLGIFALCTHVLAQNRTITGTVRDDKGSGLPNVSVQVKGTNLGVLTNESGYYSISVPTNARSLVFSSIDMGVKEITIGNETTINTTLSPTDKSLQEVVVVAYGTQKRADITGAVSTVKAADLENRPFSSVDKALQGQVAGLQSVSGSGAPGANTSIRIRGTSTITAGNNPLWVIDGVPVNTGDASRLTTSSNLLNTLNPNDIESISVLKDAASQSIYGSRAANGVILVTTKSGRAGKTRFRFDTEVGQSDIAYQNERYRPLNASEYLTLVREGLIAQGSAPSTIDATLNASFGAANNVDFNWLDAILQKGRHEQYNLSASGGNDKTTFFMSGSYFNQIGTVIYSHMKRYSSSFRLMNKATDKLTFNLNVNGGAVDQRTPSNGGAFANPVLNAYFLQPTRSAYKSDGSLNYNTPDFPYNVSTVYNTLALEALDQKGLDQMTLRGNFSAEYAFIKNLRFRTSFGTDYNTLEELLYQNPIYGTGTSADPTQQGRSYSYYTRYFNYIWTNLLSYRQDILKNGDLYADIQLGYEAQKSKQLNQSIQARGFPSRLDLIYPATGATPQTASANPSEYAFVSQFSSLNLNFKDKYILSGSFRRDGSSRFGTNNRYGNFWSVGASWNVDKEDFMNHFEIISQLKLRTSYGVNGNANIGNYDWQPNYAFGSNYNGAPGSAPSSPGNVDLTWELNKPFNFGIDVGVLKNRITLSAEYYNRKSEDVLLNQPLSRTTGFTTALRNVGSVENKGVELTLTGVPIQTKDLTWNINFNFAHNKNRVLELPFGQDIISSPYIRRVGEDISSFYLREYAGVNPANGDPLWYIDRSKSDMLTNNVSSAQRVILGSAAPKYFGGFTNTISYKGFELEAQLNYNFGNLILDGWGSYYLGSGFGATFNKVARQLDRWTTPGQVTDIPRYIHNGNLSFHDGSSSFYLSKGDYVRLRNLQFGYNFSKALLSKIRMSSAFLYIRGTNLYTWVKDKNLPWDPEQGVSSSSNLEVFMPKTITAGVNIGF